MLSASIVLAELGRKHLTYGVQTHHYERLQIAGSHPVAVAVVHGHLIELTDKDRLQPPIKP